MRFPVKWRKDSEYKKSLTKAEADWLSQFEAEYYGCNFPQSGALHSAEQQSELLGAQNHAWADIVTQTSERVAAHLAKECKSARHRAHYYCPSDYPLGEDAAGADPEDAMIDAIDAARGARPPAPE